MLKVPHIDQLLYCASYLAYAVDPSGEFKPTAGYVPYLDYIKGYTDIKGHAAPSSWTFDKINACIFVEYPQYRILAFRGTLSNFHKCATYQDWLGDLNVEPTPINGANGKVHSGIYEAYQTLQDWIIHYLNNHPTKPLYITGHSKGGPMSTYAAMDAINYGKVERVTTFASPRPGDVDFYHWYRSYVLQDQHITQVRYENNIDLVPLLPPEQGSIDDMVNTIRIIGAMESVINLQEGLEIEIFANLLAFETHWNYHPIGQLRFINKDHHVVGESQAPWSERFDQFLDEFYDHPLDPMKAIYNILSAHLLGIGSGYQKGVCPNLTKSS